MSDSEHLGQYRWKMFMKSAFFPAACVTLAVCVGPGTVYAQTRSIVGLANAVWPYIWLVTWHGCVSQEGVIMIAQMQQGQSIGSRVSVAFVRTLWRPYLGIYPRYMFRLGFWASRQAWRRWSTETCSKCSACWQYSRTCLAHSDSCDNWSGLLWRMRL